MKQAAPGWRIRVRLEPTPRVPEGEEIKPFVRVSASSSRIGGNDSGRLVIGNFIVEVQTSTRVASGPSLSIEQSFKELIRSAIQAAAGRVWNAMLEELSEEASPSRPGRPPGRVTGALVESIRIKFDDDGLGVSIGSELDYAVHLEFGTMDMPARPFLIPALVRSKRMIKEIIELAASAAIGIRGSTFEARDFKRGLAEFDAYKGTVGRNFDPVIGNIRPSASSMFDTLLELTKTTRLSDDSIISVR